MEEFENLAVKAYKNIELTDVDIIAEAYEEIVNTRKTELLDKVFGKDDTAKERWRK